MTTIDKIRLEIVDWAGDFDRLVNFFNSTQYGVMLDETNFKYIDYECFTVFYADGDWRDFLHYYVQEMLMEMIDMVGSCDEVDNLFRLWREY